MKTEEILSEREKTHGDFNKLCELVGKFRELSLVYRREGHSATQQIALEMIYIKLARIICGDPNHVDHWDDIAGYAMLGKGGGRKPYSCDGISIDGANAEIFIEEIYQVKCCRSLGACSRMRFTKITEDGAENWHCDTCGNYIQILRKNKSTSSKMEHVAEEEKPIEKRWQGGVLDCIKHNKEL